jgi:asparagine synthase (glutamine-hydrolysing)
MCGIAGWIGDIPQPERRAERMASALHHRGPDARDARFWDLACLVHTRLKIIDLSEVANQPMPNEDGTVWTVYNGEIYNHAELQHWLESRGHRFRSRCDTEVIPHLYEEHGADFVQRLRGMFAFALLDLRRQYLLLARDRFGIKPLVYAEIDSGSGQSLAFASEINALRQLPDVDQRPDAQAVSDFMALSYIPAPQTFFRGIRAVSPGELVEASWTADSVRFNVRKYHAWTIAPRVDLGLDRAASTAGELVRRAVARQIESDVPLGALLSGGIDSSLVSALAQQALPAKLQTFNVRFPDAEYDETPAAVAVADHIGSEHSVLDMEQVPTSWESVTSLLLQPGQPFGDTSLFGVNAIARLMRQHVTVALSGDGGDEGFGGYATFSQIRPASWLGSLPTWLGETAALPVSGLSRLGTLRDAVPMAVRHLVGQDEAAILEYLLCWIRPSEHAALCGDLGALPPRRHFEQQWQQAPEGRVSKLERLSMLATEVWTRLILANDFLPKVDIASMRESLEVRVPMLDEDLFEFGLTMPQHLKFRSGLTKPVLREVARTKIPEHVAKMPKHGFGVPVDVLFDRGFKDRLRETLLGSTGGLSQLFEESSYRPAVLAFCDGSDLPGVSRAGVYQRAVMLLSVSLALSGAPEPHRTPADPRRAPLRAVHWMRVWSPDGCSGFP